MKKTFLSILLAACMLISVYAYANESTVSCTYDQAGKSHITGEAKPGQSVTVRIFKKRNHVDENGDFSYAKAQSDLKEAIKASNIQSVLCFADETSANGEGVFSFVAKISTLLDSNGIVSTDPVSDVYVAVTKTADGEAYTEYLFVEPSERATDYRALADMKASSEADVKAFLAAHEFSLGFYVPVMDDINSSSAYGLIYDYLADKEFDVADKADDDKNEEKNLAVTADLLKLVVIEALNQSGVDTIDSYEKELNLSENKVNSWYIKERVDDDFKSALTTRLSGKNYKDIDEFDKAFTEAVVLEYVVRTDGIDECMAIIGDFKEDIGYNKDDVIDESAVREVMGTSYADYTALKDAIDSYEEEDDDDSSSSSGSSNRGGGKGFGGITASGTASTAPQAINTYFSDLSSVPWAVEAINYLSEKNVLAGKGNGIFAPNDNVTRAEFAKILVTAFGLTTKTDIAFADVSEDSWYSDYVKIAVGSGIAKGTNASTFGPQENITRQDMAVMLMNAARIAKAMADNNGNTSFADETEISDYAKTAVNTLTKAGIISGTGDGSFAPKAYATRAQAAKLVHGLLTY